MIQAKMSEGGRVVIPIEIRKALGLQEGDVVLWELVEGEARLTTKRERMRRAQALIQRYCPKAENESVVDEFIAERRREATTE